MTLNTRWPLQPVRLSMRLYVHTPEYSSHSYVLYSVLYILSYLLACYIHTELCSLSGVVMGVRVVAMMV